MELVCDRNSQIKHSQNSIKHIDEMNSILEYELADLHSKTDIHKSHEAQISQLSEQIRELQMDCTFHCQLYTANVRELYYSLLSLRIPHARISPIVQNVICHLMPSLNIRLPGKSCAACMHSAEMPTISSIQKASELVNSEQWHLYSDGTMLQQTKKVAFLINGIVLGVRDVCRYFT